MSVNCTDCRILQKRPGFVSYKFKGKSGLQYEVALGILTGKIKWLNGRYLCKDWPDITNFWDTLKKHFELGERVEADDGYAGESQNVTKVPQTVLSCSSEEADALQKRVQGCHEMANTRLKSFRILEALYRHDPSQHDYAFREVAVLVQLAIINGDPLFQVKYKVVF